ncbi:MAG: serine hydrolase [Pseudomonadales bacterium]
MTMATILRAVVLAAGLSTVADATEPGAGSPDSRTIAAHPQVRGALNLLDRWIEAHQIYERVPGISVGVVLNQDLIWHTGYGLANVAQRIPADADTVYSICSISKLFTSIAVMQQRDAGRLQLDDPVARHLDWFDVEQAHPDSGAITVRGLLTHSSGLPRESLPPYWNPDYPFPSRAAMIEALGRQRTLYPADRYFQYSNLALTLAGEVAAAVAGKPYAELVRDDILTPLGLSDTRTFLPTGLHGSAMALGYAALDRAGERALEPAFDTAGITPAAGFTSNVRDLARFAAWQFRLLDDGGTEVLRASTLREMQRVHWVDPDWKTTWGLGFAVRKLDDDTLVSHGGSCPGYTTAFTMVPKHRLAVIVLTNANGTAPGRIARAVYQALGPALKKARDDGAPADLPDLSAYEGLYQNPPWSSEVAMVQQGQHLLVADLPSDDLDEDLQKLARVGGDVFQRVRDDGDDPGETWTFSRDANGAVSGVAMHGVRMTRVR